MTMTVDRITYGVERVINIGNYESIRIKAELSASTDDFKKDMVDLKKMIFKSIDHDAEVITNHYKPSE